MNKKAIIFFLLEVFLVVLLMFFVIIQLTHAQGYSKYEKWQSSSYFRGFNVLNENPKNVQDFVDLKNTGANFAMIGSFGFRTVESPYNLIPENIAETDSLVSYCRQAGVYYAIAVRQGPGRRDVYLESSGLAPASTIWNNLTEQALYAGMCREIVERYENDTLFTGINLFVEPNPLGNTPCAISPEILQQCLDFSNINMSHIMSICIDSIRTINAEIPVIVSNVQYSTPEFFSILQPQSDPYVIYDFHNYVPQQFTKADVQNSVEYPGDFLSISAMGIAHYDRNFIKNTTFSKVREFQMQTNSPVIMGEFGMLFPQIGGEKYLSDVTDIAICSGWHLAYWDYRRNGINWNYEDWDTSYWDTVKYSFVKSCSENFLGENVTELPSVHLFPNPVSVNMYLQLSVLSENIWIEINDLSGTIVYTKLISEISVPVELDLSLLPMGFYFVKCTFSNSVITHKIIKS